MVRPPPWSAQNSWAPQHWINNDNNKWQGNSWDESSHTWSRGPSEDTAISDHIVSIRPYGWEKRAFECFSRDGFVVVTDVLEPRQCEELLQKCENLESKIVDKKKRSGNRGPGRYSFGNASSTGSTLHIPMFADYLLNTAGCKLHPLLCLIFEEERAHGPICTGGGGDFVLGGVTENQPLHADLTVKKTCDVLLPPPMVSANFAVQDITSQNGPMRIVPGSQLTRGELPESDKWWQSWLYPLPAGAAIVRDVRTIHSGTRNLTQHTRYLPSIEFVSAKFRATDRPDCFPPPKSLPLRFYNVLCPEMKTMCWEIVDNNGSLDAKPPQFSRR